eukprot:6209074-Pleurochrysis_carterae.AAC.5
MAENGSRRSSSFTRTGAKVPLHAVKAVKERTGLSLQRCKEALVATDTDIEAAVRWLAQPEATPSPPASAMSTALGSSVASSSSSCISALADPAFASDASQWGSLPCGMMACSVPSGPAPSALSVSSPSSGLFDGMSMASPAAQPSAPAALGQIDAAGGLFSGLSLWFTGHLFAPVDCFNHRNQHCTSVAERPVVRRSGCSLVVGNPTRISQDPRPCVALRQEATNSSLSAMGSAPASAPLGANGHACGACHDLAHGAYVASAHAAATPPGGLAMPKSFDRFSTASADAGADAAGKVRRRAQSGGRFMGATDASFHTNA